MSLHKNRIFAINLIMNTKNGIKKPRGRPRNQIGARRLLDEAQTLPKHHPAVAELLDTLASVDADETAVETALGDAINALRALNVRPQPQAAIVAQKTKVGFSPADCVARLSQDKRTLARLSAVIQAELAMVETDLAEAEANFRGWALRQPRVDQYKHNFLTRLEAAGFDARAARKISNDDLEKIIGQFKEFEQSLGKAQPSALKPEISEPHEMTLDWRKNNPWVEVVDTAKGYRFESRPISPEEILKWRRCGLPPSANLEDYDCPELFEAFQSADNWRTASRLIWKICESWLKVNVKFDIEASKVRENAWIFLFGLRYGYENQMKNMNYILFPSPITKDSVLCSQRTK